MLLFHHIFVVFQVLCHNVRVLVQLVVVFSVKMVILLHQVVVIFGKLRILLLKIIVDENNLLDLFFQLVHLILEFSVILMFLLVQTMDERRAEVFGIIHHRRVFQLNLLAFALII